MTAALRGRARLSLSSLGRKVAEERQIRIEPGKFRLREGDAREGACAQRRGWLLERTKGASGARGGAGIPSGVRLAIVGLRSGLARQRDAAIEIDTGDGRWGEQGGRDEGGEATGLRECPSSPWCMQNDADHNVTRMNLGHAPTQVAPPRFLVTRAVAPRFAVN